MALGLPLAGALLGGFGSYALGFTSLTAIGIGASVGWLVGSWGMYSMMDMKNDPIDTGANEAPRFNTAVRGAIVPILFGTNRVPAQIIFQQNFEAIRIDSGGGTSGGGLFGGSGMGGKSPSAPASVSYQYKIDAVYHLGMPVSSVAILGGWVGSQKITDDSINSIALGGSSGYQSIAEETEDENDAGISYDEAIYFDGNIDEDNTWSYLTSQVGAPIVWPGTTWVGFRGLTMGAQANMPQLSFELGPSGADITLDTNPIFRNSFVHDGSNAVDFCSGADENGTTYWSGQNFKAVAFDGTVLWEATGTELWTNFRNTASGSPHTFNASGPTSVHVQPVSDGTKLAWYFENFSSGRVHYIAVTDIPSPDTWVVDDLPSIGSSWIWYRCASATTFNGCKFLEFRDILNQASMLVLVTYDFSAVDEFFWCMPPTEHIFDNNPEVIGSNETGDPLDPLEAHEICTLRITSAENISVAAATYNQGNLTGTNFPWWVVTNFDTTTLTTTNMVCTWVSKWRMGGAGPFDTYAQRYEATYPNGVALKYAFPINDYLAYNFGGSNSALLTVTAASETVINDKFINSSGEVVAPTFFGESLNALSEAPGSGEPVISDSPVVKTLGAGIQLVVFVKHDGDDGYYPPLIAAAAGARAFLFWSQITINGTTYEDVFVTVGQVDGFVAQQNDLGQTWSQTGNQLTCTYLTPFYYGGAVYMGGIGSNTNYFISKIAQIELQATDVTPPYIIRQILVHEVFGIDPGADIIDETSYQDAVDFCEFNNVKVSTQYRREGPALQFIELLLALYGGWLTVLPAEGRIKFGVMDLANAPVRTIDNDHLVIMKDGDLPVEVTKGSPADTANIIRVNYIDRELGYQQNQVEDRDEVDEDLTGPRTREFPPDFVMSRETAQWLATRTLWNGLYTRDAYKFHLGWKDADLEPGDVITLIDSHDNIHEVAQLVTWKEVQRGIFEVHAAQQLPYVAGRIASQVTSALWGTINDGGTSVHSLGYWTGSGTISTSGITTNPSSPYGYGPSGPLPAPVYAAAYELPQEYQASASEVYVGWRAADFAAGARLYTSVDGVTYAPLADVSPYPIAGTFITDIPLDNRAFVEGVEILLHPTSGWTANSPSYTHNLTLNDVNEAAMHAGAGLIWCGSEMLAYQNITLVGQNRYRLKRLYRGWGGTAKHSHSSGDSWHKHGSGIFAMEYTSDQVGTTIYYKVTPYNSGGIAYNVSSVVAQTYQVKGAYYKPQNPSAIQYLGNRGLTKIQVGSQVDIPLEWQDGARKSGFGSGGYGTAPGNYGGFATDTMSHFWEVVVVGSGDTVVRSTTTGSPGYTYSNSMNFADNGAWRGNVAMSVTAVSPYGRSPRTSVISMELFI